MSIKKSPVALVKVLLPGFITFMFLYACSYTLKITDGRTAYDRKQFNEAIPMLQNEFARAKTRADKGQLSFLIGESYRRTGQDEKSLNWYKTAYDNNYGPDALKASAFTLKKLERYLEAQTAFKDLGIEIGSPYEYRKELTACTIAADWLKQVPQSGLHIEAAPFNSAQNDFAPVLYPDGRLVFTSDRALGNGETPYKWTGNKFMDLYIVEPDKASPQLFDSHINTPGNDGPACFNKEATLLFFVRAVAAYKGDDAFCKIYYAEKNDAGSWADPTPLPFQKEKINYLHPALSADGNTLYFSCNDPEGWGGYDLYSVNRNKNTESGWDEPKILSRNINTPGNELFPSMDADTLYFASDGLQGMGGLDIFRTFKTEKNAWSPPHNLKAPVNSGADDFGLTLYPAANTGKTTVLKPGDLLRSGYFSSNRPGGRGGDDIYRFEMQVPPPAPPKKDSSSLAGPNATHKIILEGYVLEKIRSIPDDPNSKVLGRKPLNAAHVLAEFNGKKQTFVVKEDGFFKMELADNTDYSFTGTLSGYLSSNTRFSTKGIAHDPANPVQTFEVEIVLDKIFRNQEIVLENIYYDYDKWDIRPDAEPTLNKLPMFCIKTPASESNWVVIPIAGAMMPITRNYPNAGRKVPLITWSAGGIDAERLSAIGYGESQPAISCVCSRCTEVEHQANRRTTFKVLE